MAESVRHGLIVAQTLMHIAGRLATGLDVACGLQVVANGRNRQPDVVVFNSMRNQDVFVVATPILVVEVVSPGTRVVDRFDKNVDHAETPSIQHYLMLSEERASAVLCSRDGGGWVSSEQEGSDVVALPAIGVELPLGDVYRRIVFPAGAA